MRFIGNSLRHHCLRPQSMNPESVEASIVHIAMVGKDIQLDEGERLSYRLGQFKELESQ